MQRTDIDIVTHSEKTSKKVLPNEYKLAIQQNKIDSFKQLKKNDVTQDNNNDTLRHAHILEKGEKIPVIVYAVSKNAVAIVTFLLQEYREMIHTLHHEDTLLHVAVSANALLSLEQLLKTINTFSPADQLRIITKGNAKHLSSRMLVALNLGMTFLDEKQHHFTSAMSMAREIKKTISELLTHYEVQLNNKIFTTLFTPEQAYELGKSIETLLSASYPSTHYIANKDFILESILNVFTKTLREENEEKKNFSYQQLEFLTEIYRQFYHYHANKIIDPIVENRSKISFLFHLSPAGFDLYLWSIKKMFSLQNPSSANDIQTSMLTQFHAYGLFNAFYKKFDYNSRIITWEPTRDKNYVTFYTEIIKNNPHSFQFYNPPHLEITYQVYDSVSTRDVDLIESMQNIKGFCFNNGFPENAKDFLNLLRREKIQSRELEIIIQPFKLNEQQNHLLEKNKKIPVAVKNIVFRLDKTAQLENTLLLTKLFNKNTSMTLDLPSSTFDLSKEMLQSILNTRHHETNTFCLKGHVSTETFKTITLQLGVPSGITALDLEHTDMTNVFMPYLITIIFCGTVKLIRLPNTDFTRNNVYLLVETMEKTNKLRHYHSQKNEGIECKNLFDGGIALLFPQPIADDNAADMTAKKIKQEQKAEEKKKKKEKKEMSSANSLAATSAAIPDSDSAARAEALAIALAKRHQQKQEAIENLIKGSKEKEEAEKTAQERMHILNRAAAIGKEKRKNILFIETPESRNRQEKSLQIEQEEPLLRNLQKRNNQKQGEEELHPRIIKKLSTIKTEYTLAKENNFTTNIERDVTVTVENKHLDSEQLNTYLTVLTHILHQHHDQDISSLHRDYLNHILYKIIGNCIALIFPNKENDHINPRIFHPKTTHRIMYSSYLVMYCHLYFNGKITINNLIVLAKELLKLQPALTSINENKIIRLDISAFNRQDKLIIPKKAGEILDALSNLFSQLISLIDYRDKLNKSEIGMTILTLLYEKHQINATGATHNLLSTFIIQALLYQIQIFLNALIKSDDAIIHANKETLEIITITLINPLYKIAKIHSFTTIECLSNEDLKIIQDANTDLLKMIKQLKNSVIQENEKDIQTTINATIANTNVSRHPSTMHGNNNSNNNHHHDRTAAVMRGVSNLLSAEKKHQPSGRKG